MSIPQIGSYDFSVPSTEKTLDLGVTYLMDYQTGDFVTRDGKLVEVTGIEAVKVWVAKILRTEKFMFEIYENNDDNIDYGVTVQEFVVGKKYQIPFVEAQLKMQVSEALKLHPMIDSIGKWSFIRQDDSLTIEFAVNLIGGETFREKVTY